MVIIQVNESLCIKSNYRIPKYNLLRDCKHIYNLDLKLQTNRSNKSNISKIESKTYIYARVQFFFHACLPPELVFNCSRRRWSHRRGWTAAPPLAEAWRRAAPPGLGSLPPSSKRKAGAFLLPWTRPCEAELLCCIPSRCGRVEIAQQVAQLLPSPPASREGGEGMKNNSTRKRRYI